MGKRDEKRRRGIPVQVQTDMWLELNHVRYVQAVYARMKFTPNPCASMMIYQSRSHGYHEGPSTSDMNTLETGF